VDIALIFFTSPHVAASAKTAGFRYLSPDPLIVPKNALTVVAVDRIKPPKEGQEDHFDKASAALLHDKSAQPQLRQSRGSGTSTSPRTCALTG